MNPENKELIHNDVDININEEKIVLASPTELYDEAREIAQSSQTDEKFAFTVLYDPNQKDFLLSLLQTSETIIENDDAENHVLSTRMNMTQLAFIKRLDCVDRVKTDLGLNWFLTEEATEKTPIQQNQQRDEFAMKQITHLVTPTNIEISDTENEASIAIMSTDIALTSECGCPTNSDMTSAKEIEVEKYVNGYFCCPGAEQWFKFTVQEDAMYTIHTTGNLDTIGTLYNSNGTLLQEIDDYTPCGKLNFRIIRSLISNSTYYIRVREVKAKTGNYTLRVTKKRLVSFVSVTPYRTFLELGKTYELPILPDTFANVPGAEPLNNLSASTISPEADEKKVYWSSVDNDVINIATGWYNGKRYQTLTVVGKGAAELFAYDWNGNGKSAMCRVCIPSKVSVISCSPNAWITSSKKMGSDMAEAFNCNGNYIVNTPANALDFKTFWNEFDECIIIHTHGSADGLYNEVNGTTPCIISKQEISNLPKNDKIRFIMMTACETAGGNANDNVAYWLSKRINSNGIVIANTDTVEGGDTAFCGESQQKTWRIYQNGVILDKELEVSLTMAEAYNVYKQ